MRTAVAALLAALLLVLPFASSVALRNVALWTAAALVLATFIKHPQLWMERRPPARVWLPLACWSAWCVGSIAWSVDPALSATELRPELFTPLSAFLLFYVCTPDERAFDRWAWAITLGLALLAAAAFAQHLVAGRWDVRPIHIDVGNYSTHAVAGLVLVTYLWLRAAGRPVLRGVLTAIAAATLVVLFWTDNRMTWPALGTMVLVAAVLSARGQAPEHRRRLLVVSLAAIAAAGTLFLLAQQQRQETLAARGAPVTADIDTDPRLRIWSDALQRVEASPWLGRGFSRGALRQDPGDARDGIQDPGQWHAHNVFLNVLLGLGVVGLALFAWVWGAFALELARALRSPPPRRWIAIAGLTLLASLVLKNSTDDFFVRHVALLGWSLTGALLGVLHRPAPTPTSRASPP